MDVQPHRSMAKLGAADVPSAPGVYALYRDHRPVYVGKAGSLRDRVWGNHSGRGTSLTGSALRRNVAEHLRISTATAIKKGEYRPTHEDVARVRDWLDGCEVAWMVTDSEPAAVALERALKAEHKPLLTKR